MDDFSKFKNYSKFSDEITLFYQLDKYIRNSKERQKINLDAYNHEYGSNVIKKNFSGYITILKNSPLRKIKEIVNERTRFPIETMVGFGYKVYQAIIAVEF